MNEGAEEKDSEVERRLMVTEEEDGEESAERTGAQRKRSKGQTYLSKLEGFEHPPSL